MSRVLLGLALVTGALACSGRSETVILPADQAGSGGTGAEPGTGATGGSAQAGFGALAGRDGGIDAGARDGGRDAEDEPYVDPGCPDVPAPEGVVECDVFTSPSGCPQGTGCYPDLVHPYGDGCEQQTLNVVCRLSGSGVQGDLCGAGTEGCAPGYTCIVGAEAGKRCLRVCRPEDALSCPAGYICGETDAEGIGVCA